MVGMTRLELALSTLRGWRIDQLPYIPIYFMVAEAGFEPTMPSQAVEAYETPELTRLLNSANLLNIMVAGAGVEPTISRL